MLLKNGGKIEELILFGFSAGGVVASHVMSRCKSMTCKKKIIRAKLYIKKLKSLLKQRKKLRWSQVELVCSVVVAHQDLIAQGI